jgi:uncharacterized protein YgbK (DUF1537 family)
VTVALAIGCIADDFTGATDVASALAESGLKTALVFGVDGLAENLDDTPAVVVALKTRSLPPAEAVAISAEAAQTLLRLGFRRIYLKYCSTFDSTALGNIGPVADAVIALTGARSTLFCPALPSNGRTVYQGHLFVGDRLLSESSMRDHPLNPMTDSSVVRLLGRQTRSAVGLIPWLSVHAGERAVRDAIRSAEDGGVPFLVADALDAEDLDTLAAASIDSKMATGSAGLAGAIAARLAGPRKAADAPFPAVPGRSAVISGSASRQTAHQIENFARLGLPAHVYDPSADDPAAIVRRAVDWAAARLQHRPILIAADASAEVVGRLQSRLGPRAAGEVVEGISAAIAKALIECDVTRLLVAGGETAGAVVSALGLRRLDVGPIIAPGVPWNFAPGPLAIALKSGNFGGIDIFSAAFDILDQRASVS